MKTFDGKLESEKLDQKIKEYLVTHRVEKKLAIIQVGQNLSSEKYVNLKKRYCENLGIPVLIINIDDNNSDDKIKQEVFEVFRDESVGGGIIQLPLPRKSLNSLLDLIPVDKDIDMISSKSMEQFYSNQYVKPSPVLRSLKLFLDQTILGTSVDAIVVGDGYLVGRPVAHFLKNKGMSIRMLDNYAKNQPLDCQLLVLSAGVPNLVSGEDIMAGCNVVDFGSSMVDGKTVGDLNKETSLQHLGTVSFSPGGVGPLVVRFLIMNFLNL